MISLLIAIIEFLFMHLLTISGIDYISNYIVCIEVIIFSIGFLFDIYSNSIYRKFSFQIVVIYIFHLALVVIDLFFREYIYLPGRSDSEAFYKTVLIIVSGGATSYGRYFTKALAFIMKIVGTNRFYLQFMLSFCSIISILFTIKTIDITLEDISKKKLLILVLGLLPNFSFLSSFFLREPIIIMLVSISIYYFVRWYYYSMKIDYILAFIPMIFATLLHSGMISVIIAFLLILVIFDNSTKNFNISTVKIILISILFLLLFIFYQKFGAKYLPYLSGVEDISDIASDKGRGGSSYAKYVGSSKNLLTMIIFTLPRFVYFLFSPFPWQWRGFMDIGTFMFNSLYYLYIAIKTCKSLKLDRSNKTKKLAILLVLILFVSVFIYSWGTTNTGTATRHRDNFVTLFCVLLSCMLSGKKVNDCVGTDSL